MMASGPITSWQTDRETVTDFLCWSQKSLQMVTAAMNLKDTCSLKENYDKPRQYIKKQRHHLADKGSYSQSYDFYGSHIWM